MCMKLLKNLAILSKIAFFVITIGYVCMFFKQYYSNNDTNYNFFYTYYIPPFFLIIVLAIETQI